MKFIYKTIEIIFIKKNQCVIGRLFIRPICNLAHALKVRMTAAQSSVENGNFNAIA